MSENYLYIPYKIDKSSYFKKKIIYNKTPIKYSLNKRFKNLFYSSTNINNNNNHNTNFTETVESSFGENQGIFIEANPEINPFKNSIDNSKQLSKSNQGQIKKKYYSKLDIGKIEYQFTKLYESKKDPIKPKKSRTNFSKKEFKNEKKLNSNNNNIGFKEIKYNEKSERNSINTIYHKKFGDKNTNDNKDLTPNKICMTEPNIINDLNNKIIGQYKMNNNLKSIKSINNEELNNSFNKTIYKSPKVNNKTLFKKNKNKKEINRTIELIENKNKIDSIKKNYLQKKINNNDKKPTLIKINLKNYKIARINTKLTMKDLKALKHKINKKVNYNYIQKIIKIQSIWRSFNYRKNFSFYLKFSIFKTILYTLFENINKKYFMKLLINYKKLEENRYVKDLDKPNGSLQPNINNNLINNNPNTNIKIKKYNNSLSNKDYNECLNKLNSNLNNNKYIMEKIHVNKGIKKSNSKYIITSKNLSLINNKCKIRKICHNESLNITENKSTDSKVIRNNRFKLEKERQINLSTEIKGKKRKKLKIYIEYDLEDQNKKINMIKNDKQLNEDKNNDLIQINNNVLNTINYTLKQNIDNIKESLEYINQGALTSKTKDDENQRLSLINNNKIRNKNTQLIIEKNQNILFNKENKENKREVDIKSGLQINPKEIKIIKVNNNNNLNSIQNKNECLNNKKHNISKNAKTHMMKILFPIRIKTNIIKNVKKDTFYSLMNNLKMLTFISHIMNINNKYMNPSKRDTFENMKKMHFLYYKNYYLNQKIKIKIMNLFKRYIYFKCKIFLVELNSLNNNKK